MSQDDSRVVAEACRECGMPCEPNEYHPYAACLMFRGCLDSSVVRGNLFPMKAERDALQSRLDAVAALAGELFAKADECESAHYRQTGYEIDYEDRGREKAYRDAAEKLTDIVEGVRSAALGGECRGDGEERK